MPSVERSRVNPAILLFSVEIISFISFLFHPPPQNLGGGAREQIFWKNYSERGVEGTAGWAYDVGKGRVCYLANGHTRESLSHPMMQRLLRNAINWSLKRETEEAGK